MKAILVIFLFLTLTNVLRMVMCKYVEPCNFGGSFTTCTPGTLCSIGSCKIDHANNVLLINYTISGYGGSLYLLTEAQYDDFFNQLSQNRNYVPNNKQYVFGQYLVNSGYMSSSGNGKLSRSSTEFGTLTLAYRSNPGYTTMHMVVEFVVEQDYNSKPAIIIASLVSVGCIVTLCCVGGIVLGVYWKRRKNKPYQSI